MGQLDIPVNRFGHFYQRLTAKKADPTRKRLAARQKTTLTASLEVKILHGLESAPVTPVKTTRLDHIKCPRYDLGRRSQKEKPSNYEK